MDIYDLACNQSLLAGVAMDAGSGLTAAAGQAEADNAMVKPAPGRCRRLEQPFPHARDSDLDPLRLRLDFQLLLLDVAFPNNPFAHDR